MPIPPANLTLRRFLLGGAAAAALAVVHASPSSKNHEARETATDLASALFGPDYKAKYNYLESLKHYQQIVSTQIIANSPLELAAQNRLLTMAQDLRTINNTDLNAPEKLVLAWEKYKYKLRQAISMVLEAKERNLNSQTKNKLLNNANIAVLQLHKTAGLVSIVGPILQEHRASLRPAVRAQSARLAESYAQLIDGHFEQLINPQLQEAWQAKHHVLEKDLNVLIKIAIMEEVLAADKKVLEKYATVDPSYLEVYETTCMQTVRAYEQGQTRAMIADKLQNMLKTRKQLFEAATAINTKAGEALKQHIEKEKINTNDPKTIEALK